MTTTEQARQLELNACDQVLNAGPLARRVIGAAGMRLARANRRFWEQADAATLTKLAACIDAEPMQSEPELEAEIK